MSIFTENPGLKEDIIARYLSSVPKTGYLPAYSVTFFIANKYSEVGSDDRGSIYNIIRAQHPLIPHVHERLIRMSEWEAIDPSRWSGRIFQMKEFHDYSPSPTAHTYGFTDEEDIIVFQMLFS